MTRCIPAASSSIKILYINRAKNAASTPKTVNDDAAEGAYSREAELDFVAVLELEEDEEVEEPELEDLEEPELQVTVPCTTFPLYALKIEQVELMSLVLLITMAP